MARVFNLMMLIGLFVAMTSGALVHAAETAGPAEVTSATEWLHAEGDHERVPGDTDSDAPHQHTGCHGHDLAAPLKAPGRPLAIADAGALRPSTDAGPAAGPPGSPLRPPIA